MPWTAGSTPSAGDHADKDCDSTKGTCPSLEIRRITLAQGIEFNNSDLRDWPYLMLPYGLLAPVSVRDKRWPKSMRARGPLTIVSSGNTFSYTSLAQGVKYIVTIVTSKKDFRNALLTKDMHVVYGGHARYGRGPCFGTSDAPGEDWENGTNPSTTGLFRMGYPFIGVPVDEILHHGYTADLVPAGVKVTADQAEPDLKPFVSNLKKLKISEIDPRLQRWAKDKSSEKRWLSYKSFEGGKIAPFVVLNAGWTRTVSAPADLGATTPQCRVFCHFGCDTKKHNQKILRDSAFKGWKKNGDDRFAFFTTAIAGIITPVYWLYHLFTYSVYSASGPWEPSLNYALSKVNVDLRLDGEGFQII